MRINHKLGAAAAVGVLGLAVSGCSPTTAPVTMESAGKILSENRTLSASTQMTASMRAPAGGQFARTDTDFSVRRNSNGGVTVEAAGKSLAFTAQNSATNPERWASGQNPAQVVFPVGNTTVSAISASNSDYSQIWQYAYTDNNEALFGFAAVGSETPAASLPGGSATYRGLAGAVVNGTPVVWGTPEARQAQINAGNSGSDATLTANFGTRRVEGNFTGAAVVGNNNVHQAVNLEMTLNSGDISGNQFSGTVASTGAVVFNPNNSTYTGRFFGPGAEEAAGVLELSAPGVTGVGAFHLKK